MLPVEILVLLIILNTVSIIERIIRDKERFISIYNKISKHKKKIKESIKELSMRESLKDIEINDELRDELNLSLTNEIFDETIDIFERLIFTHPI